MEGPYIVTLDIGTSSCKAVLFDAQGHEISSGIGSYPIHYPGPDGFVEQKPGEIWRGVCVAVHRLCLQPKQVTLLRAISISSQISSHFFVDAQGKPLIDIISWMDRRASKEAAEMGEAFSADELHLMLGAVLPVGASWPIPKIKWLSRNRPKLLERIHYIVQPKEWVLWKLTGEWKSDVSSMRGIVNQISREVCRPLLRWSGADTSIVPPIGNPWEVIGALLPRAAEELRLPGSIPVILGWNDLNAAVLGLIGAEETVGFDITGTSEHIGVVTPEEKLSAQGVSLFGSGINRIPFTSGKNLKYGVTSSGGFSLQWYVQQIEGTPQGAADYDSVIKSASYTPAGADELLFLPYLQGERSPWWNPNARGVFFGLNEKHYRRHMARAVLEGVGFALRAIYDRLGSKPQSIRVAGGASRIHLWNEIKANIMNVPFEIMETKEAGCLGSAMLAAFGTGIYPTLTEAAVQMTRVKHIYEPLASVQSVYESQYSRFIELYLTLEPMFSRQSG